MLVFVLPTKVDLVFFFSLSTTSVVCNRLYSIHAKTLMERVYSDKKATASATRLLVLIRNVNAPVSR